MSVGASWAIRRQLFRKQTANMALGAWWEVEKKTNTGEIFCQLALINTRQTGVDIWETV